MVFLIAGYARYKSPYVWVRSDHDRLVKFSGALATSRESKGEGKDKGKGSQSTVLDSPLKLKSTTDWLKKNTKVWDIIAELVLVCSQPTPSNPFAVDMAYFENLPFNDRALRTGAMVSFLNKVLDNGTHKFDSKIREDLFRVSKCHYQALQLCIK